MERITYKNAIELLKSKAVFAVMGGLILASCGATMGGYSETDGVYYDPNKDTIPQGVVMNNGNQIGDYYDYQYNDEQNKYLNSDNRNQNWQDAQNSDWGSFTGTETYYNDSWSYPYGYNSGFGFGMSFGFGSQWGYNGFYNPWGFGYSPFSGYYNPYYSYYNPYYGYNPYGYYNPYYGHYSPYGNGYGYGGYNSYNAPRFETKRSGSDGSGFRSGSSAVRPNTNQSSGFRSDNQQNTNTRYNGQPRYNDQQQNNSQPRYRNTPQQNSMPRENSVPRQNNTPRQQSPRYEQPARNNSNDNGFRSGSSGGGFNSGSSNSGSGSTRSSGGFRR